MILVDTSVWIDHLSRGNLRLRELLIQNDVMIHPYIIGEVACGSLKNRTEILGLLAQLPSAIEADHEEVMDLVEKEHLFGTGIGWVDAHLIGSAMLSKAKILTLDKHLLKIASALRLAA